VLATGRDTGGQFETEPRSTGIPSQITLGVTIEQTQALALAQQRGAIQLALRNPEDIRVVDRLPPETSERLLTAIRSGGLASRGGAP